MCIATAGVHIPYTQNYKLYIKISISAYCFLPLR